MNARKQSERDNQIARRIKGGRILQDGAKPSEVAAALAVSRSTVYGWKAVLDSGAGLGGLRRMSRGGRPPKLSASEKAWLKHAVRVETPEAHHIDPTKWGGQAKRWTAALICKLINQKFGIEYSVVQIRRLVGPMRD